MSKVDYAKKISSNVEYGTKIRRIWMKYQSLITDIKAGRYPTYEEMCGKRDALREEEYNILKDAPLTLQKAYKKALVKINKEGHGDINSNDIRMGNESQNLD